MPSNNPAPPPELTDLLYQALAASSHAVYCPARLGPLYDEETRRWQAPGSQVLCTCGRDQALARYEEWRSATKSTASLGRP